MKETADRICGPGSPPPDRRCTIALAGNPNVGKSTVFNVLTGLKQHTGNWPGKTVATARGTFLLEGKPALLVDLPGTYSLFANSAEEEIARDFLCFGGADATILVVDATCLERNLNLVLQVLEATQRAVVCVNLLDEAKKKGIAIDLEELSLYLGVPVVGVCARARRGLEELKEQVARIACQGARTFEVRTDYPPPVEQALQQLTPLAAQWAGGRLNARFAALRLLEGDAAFRQAMEDFLQSAWASPDEGGQARARALQAAREGLQAAGLAGEALQEALVSALLARCEEVSRRCVRQPGGDAARRDRRLDRIFTSRATGIPVMLLLLCAILWLTIQGANIPSAWLYAMFARGEAALGAWCASQGWPGWLQGALVQGVYRTVGWVVSVMLPPMAIFFPLFTLLEDAGYLPRVAFNLDRCFKRSGAHGKQALTMCMGFGCNACGVMGCRIIDSPRERMIALLTNNFVPCNGRFAPPWIGKSNGAFGAVPGPKR